MISLWLISGLFLSHLIGDFFLQSDWMALNKSKNLDALLAHTAIYSVCFVWLGLEFVFITYFFHTVTDYITSRLTSKLWFIDFLSPPEEGRFVGRFNKNRHWFFVAIGCDQFIHMVTLVWTLYLLT